MDALKKVALTCTEENMQWTEDLLAFANKKLGEMGSQSCGDLLHLNAREVLFEAANFGKGFIWAYQDRNSEMASSAARGILDRFREWAAISQSPDPTEAVRLAAEKSTAWYSTIPGKHPEYAPAYTEIEDKYLAATGKIELKVERPRPSKYDEDCDLLYRFLSFGVHTNFILSTDVARMGADHHYWWMVSTGVCEYFVGLYWLVLSHCEGCCA